MVLMVQNRFRCIPLEAQYLYRCGVDEVRRQNGARAMSFFRKAILIAPGYARAYRELGTCLARSGRGKEAEAYYRKAAAFGLREAAVPPAVTA